MTIRNSSTIIIILVILVAFSCKKEDNTVPLLSLQGKDTILIALNSEYTEPGATATDDTDGDISQNVAIDTDLDVNKVGYYNIAYTVSDEAGNISETLYRTVSVYNEAKDLVDSNWNAHDTTLYSDSKLKEDFIISINIDSTINNNIIFSRLCSEKNGEIYAIVDENNIEIPQQEVKYNDSLEITCQGRGTLIENERFDLHYTFYTDTTTEFKYVRISRTIEE